MEDKITQTRWNAGLKKPLIFTCTSWSWSLQATCFLNQNTFFVLKQLFGKKKHRIQLPFYYKCIYVNALTFILTTYFRKEQLSKNLTKISHYKTVKTRFITCINTFTCVLRTQFFPSNEYILKVPLNGHIFYFSFFRYPWKFFNYSILFLRGDFYYFT